MRRFAVLLFVCSFAAPVLAFDYDEHAYVSNLALRIALAKASAEKAELPADLQQFASAHNAQFQKSFGNITGLADYIKDIDPVFQMATGKALAQNTYEDVPWLRITRLKNDLLRFLEAAHLNENHFQQLALITHATYHEHALHIAEQAHKADEAHKVNPKVERGAWARALLLEAYADHFLEDFLASGHVATGRSGLADPAALQTHGYFNERGPLKFVANPMLAEDAEFVVSHESQIDFTAPEGSEPLALNGHSFHVVADLLRSGKPFEFSMYGDSMLRKHQDEEALIVLIVARSIAEVVTGTPDPSRNTFAKHCFQYGFGDSECSDVVRLPSGATDSRDLLRHASIEYGSYDPAGAHLKWQFYRPWEMILLNFQTIAPTSASAERARAWWGVESVVFSTPSKRSISYGPYSDRSKRDFVLLHLPIVLAGVSRTAGAHKTSVEGHLRFVLTIPRTDLQLYAAPGVRRIKSDTATATRYPVRYGIETGFGFLLAHVGVDTEYQYDSAARQFAKHHFFDSGLSLVVPGGTVINWVRGKFAGPAPAEARR